MLTFQIHNRKEPNLLILREETIMKKQQSIVVDFDGVICEHRFPDAGEPSERVQEALNTLRKAQATALLSIPADII